MRRSLIHTGIVVLILMLPLTARAISTITCHCYTERSFEAEHPAAADPYFLATTQNSFFAQVFHVDKKTIVMKKQKGSSSDDLWIAYWISGKTGVPVETLLQDKQNKGAWRDVVASLRISANALGARFSSALNAKLPSAHLAEIVVEEIFLGHHLMDEMELAALRQAGASNQGLIIATVVAARMKRPAGQIYREVASGTRTWGYLLTSAKIDTKNMQQEIAAILKL